MRGVRHRVVEQCSSGNMEGSRTSGGPSVATACTWCVCVDHGVGRRQKLAS